MNRNPRTSRRTGATSTPTAVLLAGAVIALTGCTASDDPAPTRPPTSAPPVPASPSPSSDPTAEAEEAAEADAARLPFPPEEIPEWASRAVPDGGSEGFVVSFRGWLSENTTPSTTNGFEPLEPGLYTVQLACAGDGTITLETTATDGATVAGTQQCQASTVGFDVTTTTPGIRFDLTLDGAPTVYAVSVGTGPQAS